MLMLLLGLGIGKGVIGLAIEADHFDHGLVRAVGVFVFNVQHRVDPMLVHQRAKTIFPAKAGEKRAVMEGSLPIEIELRGPPRFRAIFEFDPGSDEVVAMLLGSVDGIHLNFEVAGLFEMMRVGYEVGRLLRCRTLGNAKGCARPRQQAET
jgi:hypothetical protein